MTEASTGCPELLRLAADGVASIVPGCTAVLAAGARGNGTDAPRDRPLLRGLDYFGPPIIEHWQKALDSRSWEERLTRLVELARLTNAASRAAAAGTIEQVAPTASAGDRGLAVEYLTAIPLAIRRSLVPDRTTGQPTLFPPLTGETTQDLMRVLPADVPPFPIGSSVPGTPYELDELLGLGGFGAVYRARNRFEQNQPPRAIKFCLDPAMVATLHRERAILDRLMLAGGTNWSNRIVRLYGYALDVQPPFLVYEYAAGGDLTSYVMAVRQKTGRGFQPKLALELVRQVTEALALAHKQGLVHRDLKPANVLVSGSTVKVTDFGIGGVVATQWTRTQVAASAATQASAGEQAIFRGSGTPLYMSVEQRRGDAPDPRHDIYSLGVVWYQLLVGDVGRELHAGWQDELAEEFGIPAENIALIQRCVGYFRKRPADAGELLQLLPRQFGHTPAASSVPGDTSASSTTQSAVAAGAKEGEPSADFNRLKAQLVEQIDRDAHAEARRTIGALLRMKPDDPELREVRDFLQSQANDMARGEVLRFQSHQGWVRAVAVSPDGERALSAGDDGTVRLWSLPSGRELRVLSPDTAAVMSVAFMPDGRRAVSGGWSGVLRIWDLDTGENVGRFKGDWQAIKSLAVSAGGRLALLGGGDGVLRMVDLKTGREFRRFVGHTDVIQSVAASADGRLALSGSDDKSLRLWDLQSGKELRRFVGHGESVTAVAIAPDVGWVASASSDNSIRLWEAASGRLLRRLEGHANWINSIAISPDGRHLVSGSGGETRDGKFHDGTDTTVRYWDIASGKELSSFTGHTASVTTVALTADGRYTLSGSLDRTVRLWELPRQPKK